MKKTGAGSHIRMDFVIRTRHSPGLEEAIRSEAEEREELSEIRDRFYRP